MPSRRPHTNSHHGCLQCKAKRVKCDQLQPKCSRCEKRGSECTYRHLMTSYNPFQPIQSAPPLTTPFSFVHQQVAMVQKRPEPPTPSSASSAAAAALTATYLTPATTTSTPIPIPQTPAVPSTVLPSNAPTPIQPATTIHPSPPLLPADSSDTFLFHHYTDNLAIPHMSPILESDLFTSLNAAILLHARSVPYVRHIVLSFSALHLASIHAAAYSSPSTSTPPSHNYYHFLSTALTHKDIALQLFLPAVRAGIASSSAEPLLAASAVLVACEFALPAADPVRRTAFDIIDILAQVAGLFQGTNHIFQYNVLPRDVSSSGSSSSGSDSSSPAAAPLSPGDDVPWSQAEDSVRLTLNALESLPPAEDAQEQNRRSVLHHAAMKLHKAFSLISTAQRDFHVLCVWLGMVKKEFVDLIHSRDPLALVLLAHWAVCRTNMDAIWWARGWPSAAVTSINDAVDENHRPLLEWCLSQAKRRAASVDNQSGQHVFMAFQPGSG